MHASRDGVPIVHHDALLDRTTDGPGPIAARTAAELAAVRVRGREPFPLLEQVLTELPNTRITVELKSGTAVAPVLEVLARTDSWHRVCLGSYHDGWLDRARRLAGPRLCTSLGQASAFGLRSRAWLDALPWPGPQMPGPPVIGQPGPAAAPVRPAHRGRRGPAAGRARVRPGGARVDGERPGRDGRAARSRRRRHALRPTRPVARGAGPARRLDLEGAVRSRRDGRRRRGAVLAWGLWDWGSSAFNAVIGTFVFAVYLTGVVGADLPGPVSANSWLGYTLGAAGLLVALLAPLIGQRADATGHRRRSVGIWTALVVACTAAMFGVQDDHRWFAMGLVLLGLGSICFELASVPYNALLLGVSTPATIGRVSGFGWAMGYLGGIFLLLIVYAGFIAGEGGLAGLPTENGFNIRVVALVAAGWFALFALPLFRWVPEPPRPADGLPGPAGCWPATAPCSATSARCTGGPRTPCTSWPRARSTGTAWPRSSRSAGCSRSPSTASTRPMC